MLARRLHSLKLAHPGVVMGKGQKSKPSSGCTSVELMDGMAVQPRRPLVGPPPQPADQCLARVLTLLPASLPPPAPAAGTLAGDYGYDPLGLAKDSESLAKYQTNEVLHGRWAMLAAAGAIIPEGEGQLH